MQNLRGLILLFVVVSLLGSRTVRADALRRVDHEARGHGGGGHHHSSSAPSHDSGSRGGSGSSGWGNGGRTRTRSYGGSSSSSSGSYTSRWQSRGTYDRDEDCGHFAGSTCVDDSFALLFTMYTLGMPWTVPRLYDHPELVGYAPYPFARGPGLLRVAEGSSPEAVAQDARKVALSVEVESGYQLQGVVPASIGTRLLLPYRFELDTRSSLLSDIREHPTQLAAAGTAHLAYRFAQGPRVDFRMGVGIRNFTLGVPRWGVDVMYAVDGYIARRAVLRIELHVGSAQSSFVGQVRSTLGFMLGRAELYAGYDHTVYHGGGTAKLGGPLGGLRIWF
ncbi:MAG: hypothetical protein JWN48_3791 [Myxococcaceae bacterium]|nr:hypothetical protein [Myxococcaceae bacterium]